MRPRILHLISTLDLGGAENQLLLACRELREHCDLWVAYLMGSGGLAGDFEELGIAVHDLSRHPHLPLDPRVTRALRRLVAEVGCDILHTHLFKADVQGAIVAGPRHRRSGGAPRLISSKHNEDQHLRVPGVRAIGRWAMARADRVVAISDAVARFLERHAPPPPGRLVRIHYGFDVAAFDRRDEAPGLRASLRIPADAPLAIFVGRFMPQKGLATLIDAAALLHADLPTARIALVGRGPLEDELRRHVQRRGLEEVVRFAGFRADVRGVLTDADCLVLPSRWEGFGMVLVEAMAARRAVVATRAGSIPEVVQDGETALLSTVGDSRALAANLFRVLCDRELARALGIAGRARVETCFAPTRMAAELTRLYEDVLAGDAR